MSEAEEKLESRNITWEIIPLDKFPKLLSDTIRETVWQDITSARSATELYGMPERAALRDQVVEGIQQDTSRAIDGLRAIQTLLEQDLTKPIPIDHKYEGTQIGSPIIALDLIGNSPK